MSQTKQACKCKKSKKALSVSVLGVAGMSLAATGAEAAVLSPVTALQPMPFSEEEISDVSLATFHLYDKDKGTASSAMIQVGSHCWRRRPPWMRPWMRPWMPPWMWRRLGRRLRLRRLRLVLVLGWLPSVVLSGNIH